MTDNSQPPGDGTAPPPSTTQTSQSTNQEDPPGPSDIPLRAIQAAENLAQALRQFQPAIQGKNRQPPPPPPPPPPPADPSQNPPLPFLWYRNRVSGDTAAYSPPLHHGVWRALRASRIGKATQHSDRQSTPTHPLSLLLSFLSFLPPPSSYPHPSFLFSFPPPPPPSFTPPFVTPSAPSFNSLEPLTDTWLPQVITGQHR